MRCVEKERIIERERERERKKKIKRKKRHVKLLENKKITGSKEMLNAELVFVPITEIDHRSKTSKGRCKEDNAKHLGSTIVTQQQQPTQHYNKVESREENKADR